MTRFGPAAAERIELGSGAFLLRSRDPLRPYGNSVGDYLPKWAEEAPDRVFLAERDRAGAWRQISFGQMWSQVRALAQFLLDRGASAERPLAILSENSIAHGAVSLAALYAGIALVPISPAYSTIAEAADKLIHCYGTTDPSVVFVEDGLRYGPALDRLGKISAVTLAANPAGRPGVVSLEEALATKPTDAVDKAHAAIDPDTLAKILFTSGSTGLPKGVINTHRMLAANQQQFFQIYPFVEDHPPVVLDWLPWHHTFGGNEIFYMALRHGGTIYIDSGKPVPALFGQSLANLREISPTVYFNVPRGYDLLLAELEKDEALCRNFFQRLDFIFYSAAALPQRLLVRLEELAAAARGGGVPIVTAWGATETAPLATGVHFPSRRTDNIGLPVPGCDLKFAPFGDKYEIRVKGPHVTPGYWREPEKTKAAFDEDGFYCSGDGVRLADEADPSKGILFEGRVTEDFKLSTGTWVSVGQLRIALVNALLPVAQDIVIAGHDRDAVGILIFQNADACRALGEDGIVAHVSARLREHNRLNPTSSKRVERALLMTEPASLAGNEITDKGYVNQRAVLSRRADLVTRLHEGGEGVILLA